MNGTNSPLDSLEDRIQHTGRIIVGIDGSAGSLSALRHAARLAEALKCPVVGLTVWQAPEAWPGYDVSGWSPESDAHEVAKQASETVFGAQPPVWYSSVIRSGPTARQLMAESEGAEMLVVGSRGRGGFAGLLLGSVSSACAQHAKCPVLVVHDAAEDGGRPAA